MRFLSFGEVNINQIYILISGLFLIPTRLCYKRLYRFRKQYAEGKEFSVYSLLLTSGVSKLLCGILEIISWKFQVKDKNRNKITINTVKIFQKENKYNFFMRINSISSVTLKKLLFILLMTFAETLYTTFCISVTRCEITYSSVFLGLNSLANFLSSLLYLKIMMHYKLYKHHLISAACITIGYIIVFYDDIYSKTAAITYAETLFLSFIAPYRVLQKYIIDILFYSPYMLLFIEGIIQIVIALILGAIFEKKVSKDSKYFPAFSIDSYKEIFTIIFDKELIAVNFANFLGNFIYGFSSILLIKYYSPTHLLVSDCISNLILCVVSNGFIRNLLDSEDIIQICVGFSIILFFCLVYNEIIIFNVCGMDYYVQKNIRKRALNDASVDIDLMMFDSLSNYAKDYKKDIKDDLDNSEKLPDNELF